MDRSSRLRSGTLTEVSILPPRCIRKVRSLTLLSVTPSTALSTATIASACSLSRAAQVTSTRSRSWPIGVTSSAVTAPPACSTAWVSSLTARPRDGTSSRTVIEYDTLGATDTSVRLPTALVAQGAPPWCRT